MKKILVTGAILMALGVIIGAFGAHGLKDKLSEYGLAIFEKGSFYHFVHGLGMILLPSLVSAGLISEGIGVRVGIVFGLGIVFFSFSLYALAITDIKWLGAITPIGGTLFIAGWGLLAWGAGKGQ